MWIGFGAALGILCCAGPAGLYSLKPAPEPIEVHDPAIVSVTQSARLAFPAPERERAEYMDYASARLERGLDLEGASRAAQKALVLEPEDPLALLLLVEVSGASGGAHGPSLQTAGELLSAIQGQPGVPQDSLALAQAAYSLALGDLVGGEQALDRVVEPSWRVERLRLALALQAHDFRRAEQLAGALSGAFPMDASLCWVGFEREQAQARYAAAEALVNACLGEGVQDLELLAALAELADRTGRPAVALSRYAAAGMGVEAATLSWQEGLGEIASQRGQLRGDSAQEREQRVWMALAEGDLPAALVESEGLLGPARAAVLLQSGATPQEITAALPNEDTVSLTLRALAHKDSPQESQYWLAALEPWPAHPEVLRAWMGLGGSQSLPALARHLDSLDPVLLSGSLAVPERSSPWQWVAPVSWAQGMERVHTGPALLLAGELELASQVGDPLIQAHAWMGLAQPKRAQRTLQAVPRSRRDPSWSVAMARTHVALQEATAAQALLVPLLSQPAAQRVLILAFAQRQNLDTALLTLQGLLESSPQDQALWALAWQISLDFEAQQLDSSGSPQ